jgi:transposase
MTGENSDTSRYQRGVQAYASQFHITPDQVPAWFADAVGDRFAEEAIQSAANAWTEDELSLRDRSLIVIAALIAQGDLEAHLLEAVRIARRGKGRPRTRPGRAMADKAYSSAANRAYLRRRGIQAVIPVKVDQRKSRRARGRFGGRPPAFDAGHYKERNTVERCFAKLKQFRAVATRYDKRDFMYQATIDVASIRIWLRDPVS